MYKVDYRYILHVYNIKKLQTITLPANNLIKGKYSSRGFKSVSQFGNYAVCWINCDRNFEQAYTLKGKKNYSWKLI